MDKSVTFTSGNKTEALSVIRESAQWLINSGNALWQLEDLTENNPQYGDCEFYVAWLGNESVGAFMLNFDGGFIWQGFPGSQDTFTSFQFAANSQEKAIHSCFSNMPPISAAKEAM